MWADVYRPMNFSCRYSNNINLLYEYIWLLREAPVAAFASSSDWDVSWQDIWNIIMSDCSVKMTARMVCAVMELKEVYGTLYKPGIRLTVL
jgi:hypothetical protein